MKLSLIQMSNVPGEMLRLSDTYRNLIFEKIETNILNQAAFEMLKFDVLELLICTHDGEFVVKETKPKKRGKYWTFEIWLPYSVVMALPEFYLIIFTAFLFEALMIILKAENKVLLRKIQAEIVANLKEDASKFIYQMSADEMIVDQIVRNRLSQKN